MLFGQCRRLEVEDTRVASTDFEQTLGPGLIPGEPFLGVCCTITVAGPPYSGGLAEHVRSRGNLPPDSNSPRRTDHLPDCITIPRLSQLPLSFIDAHAYCILYKILLAQIVPCYSTSSGKTPSRNVRKVLKGCNKNCIHSRT